MAAGSGLGGRRPPRPPIARALILWTQTTAGGGTSTLTDAPESRTSSGRSMTTSPACLQSRLLSRLLVPFPCATWRCLPPVLPDQRTRRTSEDVALREKYVALPEKKVIVFGPRMICPGATLNIQHPLLLFCSVFKSGKNYFRPQLQVDRFVRGTIGAKTQIMLHCIYWRPLNELVDYVGIFVLKNIHICNG